MSNARMAGERDYWKKLDGKWKSRDPLVIDSGVSPPLHLNRGTSVVGGLNGAGKSRLLRTIHRELGSDAILLRMSEAVEQTLLAVRSIEELDSLAEETGAALLEQERRADVERIVGREYQDLEWFSLEIEELQEGIEPVFANEDGTILVPHFKASYGGLYYSSVQMGLGEFSVHLLMWLLEQYRDARQLTVILDEPDAFLPPSAALRMIHRVQRLAYERDWRLIVASHSEALIEVALRKGNFVRLFPIGGEIRGATVSTGGPDSELALDLLPHPAARVVAFCEDELAALFFEELMGKRASRGADFFDAVWKDGHGYLRVLDQTLPAPASSQWIKFVLVLDGDQRDKEPLIGLWPSLYLPGVEDPAKLLHGLRNTPSLIAEALNRSGEAVTTMLGALEGYEAHDWVAALSERYGSSEEGKRRLIRKWIEVNPQLASDFVANVHSLPI